MKKTKALYKIENKLNGKKYIGSTVWLEKRLTKHKTELKRNRHSNRYLQNAWNKDKEKNFNIEVLEILPNFLSLDKIRKIEYFFILSENWENLYNLSKTTHTYILTEKDKENLRLKMLGTSHAKGSIRTKEMRDNLRKINRKSGSGIKYQSNNGKYRVSIQRPSPEKGSKYLGVFNTYEEALECRLKAEKIYWV